jgi:signal transduction histidine kinase
VALLFSSVIAFAVVTACTLFALDSWRRARLAEARARLATERRDRFLGEAARELSAPLEALRNRLAALDPRTPPHERLRELIQSLDQARTLVSALARLDDGTAPLREPLELGQLVRDILAAPPFVDAGPPVILRAQPARVLGDAGMLARGLRVLLWVVRRDAGELTITIDSDEDRARLEIDAAGAWAAADALERLPAVFYGARANTAPVGMALPLRVASEVARLHGGRLRSSARAGSGERFVIELPLYGATTA